MDMHTEHALVGMLSSYQPIGIWGILGLLWIQSMYIEPINNAVRFSLRPDEVQE